MKKVIFISMLLLSLLRVTVLLSQTKNDFALKNTWEAGGSFGFASIKSVNSGEMSDETLTLLEFTPYGGYFITDGFELGISSAFGYMKNDNEDLTYFSIYLVPTYNFDTKSIAYPYIQGGLGYNSLSQSYDDPYYGNHKYTNSGLVWNLEGGVKINFFGNSLLKLGLTYDQKTLNPEDNSSGKRNGINTFSFIIGFNVFFR